ncbi:MAG: 50S ribosomal protein L14e [Candidatus Micrarchaeota archaeon]|nr:50S ribosomal protein L14e [Candidatus Micrarchaeota archaeon]MDE1849216.1 50S ribosomal protein L14e [Candidatus Micrarchaeota archaeon]
MVLLEEGRLCVKKLGRDAGDRAVITKVIDANFVSIISSSRIKERKCNVKHLEFLSERIDPDNKEQLARALEIEVSKLVGAPRAPAKKERKQ